RPAPDRWSVAGCLVHLNLSGGLYLPALDRAIADARARGLTGGGEYRPGLVGGWLARSMEPPPRARSRSRAQRQIRPPAEARPVAEVRTEFLGLQDELERRVRDAEGLDLARAKVTSPLLSLLRLRLGDALAFLLAHQRRHLWQAHRVREAAALPGS
ncbi:MAG TPA: DinB family protein, partial [Gemmatimonadales bacterium]|nr:DinB family protein [Gemmatimonadales bacterium]